MQRSKEDLEENLNWQLRFLRKSADDFDAGMQEEALRMAVAIRILLHNTGQSHSLLSQLNLLDRAFISTVETYQPNPLIVMPFKGLIAFNITPKGVVAIPILDGAGKNRSLSFGEWWEEVIFSDDKQNKLTRSEIVLSVADQDGGAHIDPHIREPYASLSRNNSLGVLLGSGRDWVPLKHPEWIAIRQIAHEVLKSLVVGYTRQPRISPGLLIGEIRLEGEPTKPTQHENEHIHRAKKGRRRRSKS